MRTSVIARCLYSPRQRLLQASSFSQTEIDCLKINCYTLIVSVCVGKRSFRPPWSRILRPGRRWEIKRRADRFSYLSPRRGRLHPGCRQDASSPSLHLGVIESLVPRAKPGRRRVSYRASTVSITTEHLRSSMDILVALSPR